MLIMLLMTAAHHHWNMPMQLGSLRMFSAFAGCDIPYFCNAADACLLTVKTMAR
jgi:hypothetical protein